MFDKAIAEGDAARLAPQHAAGLESNVVQGTTATEQGGVQGIDRPRSIMPQDHGDSKIYATGEYDDGTIGYGGFSMGEICVALGRGNLDEERFNRLKDGFTLLMNHCLGKV